MYHSTITWIIAIMMKNDVHGRSDPGMFLQTNGKVELLRFSLSSNIRQRTKKMRGRQSIASHPHPLSLNLASMMVMRFQGGPWNPRFLPAHSMISIVGLMWRMDTFEQILWVLVPFITWFPVQSVRRWPVGEWIHERIAIKRKEIRISFCSDIDTSSHWERKMIWSVNYFLLGISPPLELANRITMYNITLILAERCWVTRAFTFD